MRAYAEAYLSDVVENQGKLFDFVAQSFPDKNTEDFINTYMKSKTRKSIDEAQALSLIHIQMCIRDSRYTHIGWRRLFHRHSDTDCI